MSHNRKSSLTALAIVLASGGCLFSQEALVEQNAPKTHTIMRFDHAALQRHKIQRDSMPRHEANPITHYMLSDAFRAGATGSVNLLPYLAYTPSTWSQEYCGDCWVWGSTAAASIASGAHGNKTLFSVQWFNSSYNSGKGSNWACCGGGADTFASWYNSHPKFIPWGNTNASFKDASGPCPGTTAQAASGIATTPNVPFNSITMQVIPTSTVTQAQAIANIKAVLNNNQAIMFSFYLPGTGWDNFYSFWDSSSQSTKWTKIDSYNGFTWDSNSGGHLTCIVGYDDTDASWIILNSWGSSSLRPDGYFKIPQAMGYNDYCVDNGTHFDQYEFDTFNIVWPASTNTVTASITTPSSNVTIASGTSQNFVGTATDSSSTATLTYGWNFGDGSTATGASTSHTFTNTSASAVNYNVVLKATDNTGASNTASRTVTVNPSAAVAVAISPTTATINTGTTKQFAASVTGTTNTAVTWTCSGGAVSTSGLYTAPATAGTYTVTATSAADTTKKATATVTVTTPTSVAVTITPTTATINTGTTKQFTASVTGTTNTSVTWSCTGGTVSNGLYTAPSTTGTYTVTATSVADTTKKAAATVTVQNTTGTEKILNGGFENGSTNWAGTTQDIGAWSSKGERAYAGTMCCWLCGYGRTGTETIRQAVTIPSTATQATLSFYLHIDSAENTTSTAYDKLSVQVLNASGYVLNTLATYSNLNKATGYSQKSFDLSAYKGQTIQIYFKGTEDSSLQTSFVLDNVSLITK